MFLLNIVYINGNKERIAYNDKKKALEAFNAIKRFIMIEKATLIYPEGKRKYINNWNLIK